MHRTISALDGLVAQFEALKKNRPSDLDVEIPGFDALSYEMFESVFTAWRIKLDAIAKSKWMEATESNLVDTSLSKQISELTSYSSQAANQGANWLFVATPFADRIVDMGQRISFLAANRAGIAKSLAKDLERMAVSEVGRILEAAPIAAELDDQANSAAKSVDKLTSQVGLAEKLAARAADAASKFDELSNGMGDAHEFAKDKRGEIERLHTETVEFRDLAESKASEFDKRTGDMKKQVADSIVDVTSARKLLEETLADVKRQGLAGAFDDRAKKISRERYVWLIVFLGAV